MKNYIDLINKNLDKFLEIKYPPEIFEAMKYTVMLPGKRLRPVFCLEACRLAGGNIENAIPTACAIEMLHAQSLIHDDLPCMDNDDFRRGKPSNHKVFGEANAVLAGDALISFGPQIIIENTKNVSDKALLEVLHEYFLAAGCFGIIAGQVADIKAENFNYKNFDKPEDELNFIHKNKTAALFKLALKSGAILGNANDEFLCDMLDFADSYGMAFQIYDDIIDEISTFNSLGKTTGKDKEEGKLTYVTLYGLNNAKCKLNCQINRANDIIRKYGSEIFNSAVDKLKEGIKD